MTDTTVELIIEPGGLYRGHYRVISDRGAVLDEFDRPIITHKDIRRAFRRIRDKASSHDWNITRGVIYCAANPIYQRLVGWADVAWNVVFKTDLTLEWVDILPSDKQTKGN